MSELPELEPPAPFNEIGELRESNIVCLRTADPPPDEFYACFKSHIDFHNELIVDAHELMEATKREREVKESPIDYEALQPMFGWLPIDVICNTFAQTTQFYRTPASTHLKKRFRSPYPACNVHRRAEPLATDTVFSDVAAVDNGCKVAQLFVGTKSLVIDIYPMKTLDQFVNTRT